MNWRIVRAVALKDLHEVRRNRLAWIPAIVLPSIFVIVMPIAFFVLPQALPATQGTELNKVIAATPDLRSLVRGLDQQQSLSVLLTGVMMAPLFLILPLMFASIVGADSFVGEKERKTLEALLYTPATDLELFVGKVVASVVPAVLLAWLCFFIYTVVVDVSSLLSFGRAWFPPIAWWPLMLWVTPAFATLGMALTVIISSRVSTYQEAYQLSAFGVVIVLGLAVGQISGAIYLGTFLTFAVGTVLWVVDLGLAWLAVKTFSRSRLIQRF